MNTFKKSLFFSFLFIAVMWLNGCDNSAASARAQAARHEVSLQGHVDSTFKAQSVVTANRSPGTMEKTGHFNLVLRDPDNKLIKVQLALIDPAVQPGKFDLTQLTLSSTQDDIEACLFLPAEKPRALMRQNILCTVESGSLAITENSPDGVSGSFDFSVTSKHHANIRVTGHFSRVRPPADLKS